jgi:uncharacterized repeat protein (TIGR03803 family)
LAGLLNVDGKLYGTTYGGGTSGDGAVFDMTTAGKERVLYRFGGSPDGAFPYSGLIDVGHTFYGTTIAGGSSSRGGYGTVFSVTAAGKETVLHAFSNKPDGAGPYAGLT